MPYIQLDIGQSLPSERKKTFAQAVGKTYAELMQTTPQRVSVGIRELTDGGLWRCGDGEPTPGAVLMCDVRRGRPKEWREAIASALLDLCCDHFGLERGQIAVQFSQHAGDEMYRADEGWARDWSDRETASPA